MRTALRRTWIAAAVVALSAAGVAVPASAQPSVTPLPSGDLTGDGKSDIVARHADGRLVVYPQTNGTFAEHPVTIGYAWHSADYHWISTARIDAGGPSGVLAADTDGNLWAYSNLGYDGAETLGPREHSGTGYRHWPDGWGQASIRTVRTDGLDDIERIYASDGETSIYHYKNENVPGVDRYQYFGVDRESKGKVAWTKYSEVPGSVTRGKYRDRLVGYADGRLAVQFLEFEGNTGRYREVTIGHGWQTLDSWMLKEISGDGIPDIVARRLSDGALVAYVHSGSWSESNPNATYLQPPRVLGWGWQTVDQIS